MRRFELERRVNSPRSQAWDVLADLDGWAAHAPNLSESRVVQGAGGGAVRRCYNNAGKGWSETCTLWEPGRRYVMEVDTSDYPYPIRVMRGTFSVDDDGAGCLAKLRFDYEFKYGILGRVLGVMARPMLSHTCKRLLDSLEAEMLSRSSGTPQSVA